MTRVVFTLRIPRGMPAAPLDPPCFFSLFHPAQPAITMHRVGVHTQRNHPSRTRTRAEDLPRERDELVEGQVNEEGRVHGETVVRE